MNNCVREIIELFFILGVPSFFTIAWAVSRIYYEDTLCWTTHKNKLVFMLIRMPIVLSVFVSFFDR